MSEYPFAEKKKEFDRLLLSADIKHSPIHIRLLNELWKEIPADSTQPTPVLSDHQLASRIGLKGSDKNARVRILRTREALSRHYEFARKNPGDICLWIHRDAKRGHSGYSLLFEAFPGQYIGTTPDIVQAFWREKLVDRVRDVAQDSNQAAGQIMVIFSNERQFFDAEEEVNQLNVVARRRGHARQVEEDTGLWTGVGEMVSAFRLSELFSRAGLQADLLRSKSLILDRTQRQDKVLLFVGSSLSMKVLRDLRKSGRLRPKQRFTFEWGREPNGLGRGHIVNHFPDSEKSKEFYCEETWKTPYSDYALISHFYDEGLNCVILAVAGISTLGTEQAVRDLTDSRTLEKIYQTIGQDRVAPLKDFEVLIKVEIMNSSPTGSEIVAYSTPEMLASLKRKALN